MNLYVDLGNSRLKWAAGEAGRAWACQGACPVAGLPGALDRAWSPLPPPRAVWLAAVGGTAAAVAAWVAAHWGLRPRRLVAGRAACGVRNSYERPEELGVDRWAALVAARALVPGPVFVVDCGTAITVDALDGGGAFLGGAILPGLALAREALARGTAGVGAGAGGACGPFGRDTAAAVAGGTLWGLAGAVDRLLESGGPAMAGAAVLLTGGDGERLAPRLRHPVRRVPDLVLQGIARLAEVAPC